MNRPTRTVPLWARRPAPRQYQILVSAELKRRLERVAEQQCISVKALVEAMLHDIGRDGS